MNAVCTLFVLSFPISLFNGLLSVTVVPQWEWPCSVSLSLYPPLFLSLSLILNHHLQRQRQLKPIECFNADERHLKLNKQGTPG